MKQLALVETYPQGRERWRWSWRNALRVSGIVIRGVLVVFFERPKLSIVDGPGSVPREFRPREVQDPRLSYFKWQI